MSAYDLKTHAERFSKSYQQSFSPWQSNFDEMAKKTVIKKLLRYAPLKAEFTHALTMDGGIKKELSENMYDVPDEYTQEDECT